MILHLYLPTIQLSNYLTNLPSPQSLNPLPKQISIPYIKPARHTTLQQQSKQTITPKAPKNATTNAHSYIQQALPEKQERKKR
jgi:hypothetical protein